MKQTNEINLHALTTDGLLELTMEATTLGKKYVEALKDQAKRQGIRLPEIQ